jgi:hypothetical protein
VTQADRLRDYLRSSLEVTRDLLIVNVTGRVSDLRARGLDVRCAKRRDGYDGYWIVEHPVQLTTWR